MALTEGLNRGVAAERYDMNFLTWILKRLKEPSTWRGIIAMLTASGIALTPDQGAAITAVGLGLIGLVGAFTPDKGGEK